MEGNNWNSNENEDLRQLKENINDEILESMKCEEQEIDISNTAEYCSKVKLSIGEGKLNDNSPSSSVIDLQKEYPDISSDSYQSYNEFDQYSDDMATINDEESIRMDEFARANEQRKEDELMIRVLEDAMSLKSKEIEKLNEQNKILLEQLNKNQESKDKIESEFAILKKKCDSIKNLQQKVISKDYLHDVNEKRMEPFENDKQSVSENEVQQDMSDGNDNFSTSSDFQMQQPINGEPGLQSVLKRNKCLECGKRFGRPDSLRVHNRIHTGERPYKCIKCDKSFRDASQLRVHDRIHTGEKPFKCGQCDKSFRHATSFKVHSRTHTGDRPYKCLKCNVSFHEPSILKRHNRAHIGEKSYD